MATTDQTSNATQIRTFVLDGTQYCVDASNVASIIEIADGADSVAEASDPWYAGEIALSEDRIRVVDLRRVVTATTRRLERPDDQGLVVFEKTDDAGQLYAWLVDEVGEYTSASSDAIERTRTSARFLRGQIDRDGDAIVWLDEARINA